MKTFEIVVSAQSFFAIIKGIADPEVIVTAPAVLSQVTILTVEAAGEPHEAHLRVIVRAPEDWNQELCSIAFPMPEPAGTGYKAG